MKHLKKTPIYFAIFAASIFLSVFLHILVERNYNDFKMMLVENGRHEASTKVNSMISKIDTYRKTNTEAEVKNIVYDTLSNHVGLNNQYIWINEIVDWNGGEEYAVRFVNPNFPGQQGQPSSKGLKDIDGNPLYLIETQALKDTGELYYQYYFKNYLNDDVKLKSSYIKLYKDYNWVIGCGIPKSELFEKAQFTHTRNRQLLFLFYVSLALLNFIIFFVIYTQDKKQELKNNAKMIELKANSKIEAKSEFFSTLSHELRTPLNAIIGLNDLMRDNSNGNQVVMDYSYKIEESSKILLNLINDVLDMSAIEKGKLNIANETFVLKNIIYSISDTYYILAKKKSLDFKIHLDNIHHESLIGDQYRIRQILSNLLSNSLKFTEEGSISLDINVNFPKSGQWLSN